jgi:hypothetical protein
MKRFKLIAMLVAAIVLCSAGTAFADKHYKLTPPRNNPPAPYASGMVTARFLGTYFDGYYGFTWYGYSTSMKCQGITPSTSHGFTVKDFNPPDINNNYDFSFSTSATGTADLTVTVYFVEKSWPAQLFVWNPAGPGAVLTYPQTN